jgi:outer membrane protein
MTLLRQAPANRNVHAHTASASTIYPHPKQWAYLLLAGLALSSTASWAQTKPKAEEVQANSGGYVGLGANAGPRYQGSDESKTRGIPGFEYHWISGLFVGGTDGLVGVRLNATQQLKIGLALGLDEGREESESRYLKGMGDVAARATLNLYAKTSVNEQLGLNTGLQLGIGSSGKGGLLNLGASYGISLTPATRMSFDVEATLANTDYMQDYFGVSAAQASASGYRQYTLSSGLRDVTVSLGSQYRISREWMLFCSLKSTTLSNTAKDSPLVRKATSQSAFIAVAYSF